MNEYSTSDGIDYVWGEAATFIVHDVDVGDSGRVTLRSNARERYNVGIGDYVHLVVHTNDDNVFRVNDARVGRKGQVTIPSRQRDRYGLDVGETVTIEVLTER